MKSFNNEDTIFCVSEDFSTKFLGGNRPNKCVN